MDVTNYLNLGLPGHTHLDSKHSVDVTKNVPGLQDLMHTNLKVPEFQLAPRPGLGNFCPQLLA